MKLLSGFQLYRNQFRALMEKKYLNSLRNWVLLLVQMLIPIMFIALIILIVRSFDVTKDLPKLELSLKTYNSTVTTVQFHPNSAGLILSKIHDNYVQQFSYQSSKLENCTSFDMAEFYLNKSTVRQSLVQVNKRHLYGVSIKSSEIVAWYNNKPYHTLPISLNLAHNAILKAVCGQNCSITVSNRPLPYLKESRDVMQKTLSNLSFQLSFNISFAMAFVAAFFAIPYIKERVTKAKLLQFVSGINAFMYWSTAFLWDILTFLLIALVMTTTIGVFQEDGYRTFEQLSLVYLLFVSFGVAILPCVYLSSLLLNAPASGFTKLTIIFILPGVAMFTVSYCLQIKIFNLEKVADDMTTVFLAFPHYALSNAFSNINSVNVIKSGCGQECESKCCGEFGGLKVV